MSEAKNTAAEVGVKLVLDSNAKSEAQHIKDGLVGVDKASDAAQKGWKSKIGGGLRAMGGFAASAASLAASAAIAVGASVVGLGIKSAHAFEESEEQVRALAGTLTMIDQKGNAFEDLREYAADIKDELEELAMQAGVTDDAMVAMFTDIVERGGKSVEAAKDLTEQVAYAGRAIPGGAESLAAGFEAIQMGMIKAKNPLVQLIATTGTLKGSAKSVAKEMSKLSIDEQMELAEKAVGKMAEKMKKAPMTIAQMGTSMKVAVGNVFETAGEPIVHALEPVFEKVKGLLMDNSGGLLDGAKRFGDFIARPVGLAVPIIEGLVKAVENSWSDIAKTFNAVYGPFDDMIHYLYENKEAFATTIGETARALIEAAGALIRAGAWLRDNVLGALTALLKSGAFGKDAQNYVVDEQQKRQTADLRKQVTTKGSIDDADYNTRRGQFIEASKGTDREASAGADFDKAYRRVMDDHLATMKSVEGARDAALMDDAKKYAQMFDLATKANDVAAQQYVAKFLEGNVSLQNALAKEGPAIFKDGMGALLDALKNMGDGEIAAALKAKTKPDLGIAAKGNIVQNFNGSISIKQDFRDQDPDRVATVLKSELGRQGTNRLQSRFASPFGF